MRKHVKEFIESFDFWEKVTRTIGIIFSASATLTPIRKGELVPFPQILENWINNFAYGMEFFLAPVETTLNTWLAQLPWDINLGWAFQPSSVVFSALAAAIIRQMTDQEAEQAGTHKFFGVIAVPIFGIGTGAIIGIATAFLDIGNIGQFTVIIGFFSILAIIFLAQEKPEEQRTKIGIDMVAILAVIAASIASSILVLL